MMTLGGIGDVEEQPPFLVGKSAVAVEGENQLPPAHSSIHFCGLHFPDPLW
jgi:hypothetical protein